MATQVIWSGNDQRRLLHLAPRHRHRAAHPVRPLRAADRADLRLADHRRLHDLSRTRSTANGSSPTRWRSSSSSALDPHRFAERLARGHFDKGLLSLDIGENRRLVGQYPPEAEPDLEIASTDLERETLRWLHEVFNKRMFGKIKDVYAPTVMYHGPLMAELYGVAAVMHQTIGLIGSLPDAGLHAAAHLLEPLRGGRHQGRGALDHGGPPSRLRPAAGARRARPASGCR